MTCRWNLAQTLGVLQVGQISKSRWSANRDSPQPSHAPERPIGAFLKWKHYPGAGVMLGVRRQEANDDYDVPHWPPRRRARRLRPALSSATSRLRPDPSRLKALAPKDRTGRT